MDHISPVYLGNSSRWERNKRLVSDYKLYNNEIDQDDFVRWCQPYGIDVGQYQEEVMPFNKIPNKANILIGEEIIRGESYKPLLISQKDIIEKTDEMRKLTKEYVDSEIMKAMEKARMMMGEISEEEYQELEESYRTQYTPEDLNHNEFLTQKEIFASKVLEYAKYDQKIKAQKNLGFKHTIISDMECVWVGIDRGKPMIKVVNPLNLFFQKGPEVEYIQDGDFAGERLLMTRFDVLDKYGDRMSKEDRDKFERPFYTREGGSLTKAIDPQFEKTLDYLTPRAFASAEKLDDEGIGQYASDFSFKTTLDLVEVMHVEWKTQRRVFFLTRYNDFGDADVKIVDEQFPIPSEATKVKMTNKFGVDTIRYEWMDPLTQTPVFAEEVWIPRIWEGTRIEGDIYLDVREKPNQPISIDDPYRCAKLGYVGRVYTSTNAKSISLLSRMRPFQMMYFVAMHQLSKLLSQNQGKQLIIDQAQTPNFDDAFGRSDTMMQLFYQSKGLIFINSMSNSQGGTMPSNRGAAVDAVDMSTTADILNLTALCDWLDEQIGQSAGISKEREGQIQRYTNATDNQQAIAQSSYITEVYFNLHNELWAHVMNQYLSVFTTWAKNWFEMNPAQKEMMLQYVLDNGSIQMLKIDSKFLEASEYGIFIEVGSSAEEYKSKMEQYILPLIQNQMEGAEVVSEILKARRDGTSPEKIHQMIQVLTDKYQQRRMETEQAQTERQQEMLKAQEQLAQQEHERDLEKIMLQEELQKEREIAVNTIKTFSWNPDKDMNENSVPDVVEVANLQLKKDFEESKLKMDKAKLEQQKKEHDDKMKLENKKLKQAKSTKSSS